MNFNFLIPNLEKIVLDYLIWFTYPEKQESEPYMIDSQYFFFTYTDKLYWVYSIREDWIYRELELENNHVVITDDLAEFWRHPKVLKIWNNWNSQIYMKK